MSEWEAPTPVQLAERVEEWQHRLALLGVGHFRITSVTIDDETPAGPHAQASAQMSTSYDNVRMWFKHDYIEVCGERDLDETIVHEWLHVAMRDFDSAIDAVEAWMPKQTYDAFEERVDHEREGVVDRVSRTIVAFYYDED